MKPQSKRVPWLWVWVGGTFALMLLAWTVLLVVVSKNRVAEVPVATQPVR